MSDTATDSNSLGDKPIPIEYDKKGINSSHLVLVNTSSMAMLVNGQYLAPYKSVETNLYRDKMLNLDYALREISDEPCHQLTNSVSHI